MKKKKYELFRESKDTCVVLQTCVEPGSPPIWLFEACVVLQLSCRALPPLTVSEAISEDMLMVVLKEV